MRDRGHMAGMSGQQHRNELFGARAERLPDGPVQRTALFGRSPYGMGGGAPAGPSSATADASVGARNALEEDNNRMTAELEAKVAALKQATITIHDEVSEHNRMLTGMGQDFDKTGGLMSGALSRLDTLVRGGGRTNHMCYLILFVVAVFLVLWRFLK